MLVGITVDEFKGFKPSSLVNIIGKLGLEFIEITQSVFDDLPDLLKELGNIKTGFHLPNFGDSGYDLSCINNQDKIDALINMINRYHVELNIQYCLSHPPECKNQGLEKKNINSVLFTNLKKLKPPIIVENIQSLSQSEFAYFYNEAKKSLGSRIIGQCFDASHSYLRGEDPVTILENLDGEIKSIHLSDCKDNKDSHLPFGLDGVLPFDDILETLKKNHYSGIINLELLPRKPSDMKAVMQSYLRVLEKFDKIKYLTTKLKLLYHLPQLMKKFSHI